MTPTAVYSGSTPTDISYGPSFPLKTSTVPPLAFACPEKAQTIVVATTTTSSRLRVGANWGTSLRVVKGDAAYPYIDSMTTYAAVWATYLVIRKVLENWWYWLAIDLVSIVIYWSRELPFTSLLFVIYVLLIPFGLAAWTRSYRAARLIPAPA